MKKSRGLKSTQLRPGYSKKLLPFSTTQELKCLELSLIQPRAKQAVEYFLAIDQPDFHLFAMGPNGVGKEAIVYSLLRKHKSLNHVCFDWCYAENPLDLKQPIAIKLKVGDAPIFCETVNAILLKIKSKDATKFKFEINHAIQKFQNSPTAKKYLLDLLQKGVTNLFAQFSHLENLAFMLVNNNKNTPPIIFERSPTYKSLFGAIGSSLVEGTRSQHIENIHAGAMHKANGGYLLINAAKISEDEKSWSMLKLTLRTKEITLESNRLHPQTIPLQVKIILIGTRSDYYKIIATDADLLDFFKIIADFDEYLDRSSKNYKLYSSLLHTIATSRKLQPLSRKAVADVMNEGSRCIEDSRKLYVNLRHLTELLVEANYFAKLNGHKVIQKSDIQEAVFAKNYRFDRIQRQTYEDIKRQYILIDNRTSRVGQINALTVVQVGDYAFGHPSRVSAIVRPARSSEIINIEREIDLSGSIHSKGVLILTGFLRGHYALQKPLSLSASIVFEQTYDTIDGDSASLAELCVLLSALANVRINQALAVTGSINQHGQVQAIGYVNEKIEGFYDICQASGLTGFQGVIIPYANLQNLILKHEVVDAVKAKIFHIYPVRSVNETLSLLTGIKTGNRDKKGNFPYDTINYLVECKLDEFAIDAKTND